MARAVEQKAIRANVRYLKSKEFRTREDAIDTQASLDLIVEVNRRGLITFDSQEGGTGERAYCLGFMSASKAAVFIRAFNVATDKVAMPIFEAAEETPSSFDIPRSPCPPDECTRT